MVDWYKLDIDVVRGLFRTLRILLNISEQMVNVVQKYLRGQLFPLRVTVNYTPIVYNFKTQNWKHFVYMDDNCETEIRVCEIFVQFVEICIIDRFCYIIFR